MQDPDWTAHGNTDPPTDPFAMFRTLKDRVSFAGNRWWREQDPYGKLDTRMTAKLFVVEAGTETTAMSVARTRARLAVAIWCLLDAPDDQTLWPSVGDWLPRPFIQVGLDHKLYEENQWIARAPRKAGWSIQYGEYTVTTDRDRLAAPFQIMRHAPKQLAPRAVASASWALHLAERQPNDLERTDVLVQLRTAIEAICDIGGGPNDLDAEKRWRNVTARYDVWKPMTHLYSRVELDDAQQLARDLRNITAHGSDDVLVNLGYPSGTTRRVQGGRELSSSQQGLARTAAAIPVLHRAVREVVRRLAIAGIEDGWEAWNDARFAQEFDPAS